MQGGEQDDDDEAIFATIDKASTKALAAPLACFSCGKEQRCKWCSCKKVRYCSKSCQDEHWPKPACTPPRHNDVTIARQTARFFATLEIIRGLAARSDRSTRGRHGSTTRTRLDASADG